MAAYQAPDTNYHTAYLFINKRVEVEASFQQTGLS